MAQASIPVAKLPNIQATGPRGYLQWLRADQPGLYARVLPVLMNEAPELWSDATQTTVMTNVGHAFGSLGQDDSGADDSDDSDAESDADELAQAQTDLVTSDEAGTAAGGALSDEEELGLAQSELQTEDQESAANTANTTAMNPSTASTVSSVVNSVLNTATNQGLAAATGALSDSQLNNATAGLAPSAVGTGGIGQVFSTLTSGVSSTALLIGGGVVLLLVALFAAG